MRLYQYVGPKRIVESIQPEPTGVPILSPDNVRIWVRTTKQKLSGGCVIVTFVISADGLLLIADRHTEHVACAGGQPICSAGEITFCLHDFVEVSEVSNQSTGYCPEPESWPAVADALLSAGMAPPDGFTFVCQFRRCIKCENITLVKDRIFECGICGVELTAEYNVQHTL